MKKAKILDWISFFCLVGGSIVFFILNVLLNSLYYPQHHYWGIFDIFSILCSYFLLVSLAVTMFPLSNNRVKKVVFSFAILSSILIGGYDLRFLLSGGNLSISYLLDIDILSDILFIVFGGILLYAFLRKHDVLALFGFWGWFLFWWICPGVYYYMSFPYFSSIDKILITTGRVLVTGSYFLFFLPRSIFFIQKRKIGKKIDSQDLPPEERLRLLQEYADKGHIDPETYAKKRQEILESL